MAIIERNNFFWKMRVQLYEQDLFSCAVICLFFTLKRFFMSLKILSFLFLSSKSESQLFHSYNGEKKTVEKNKKTYMVF